MLKFFLSLFFKNAFCLCILFVFSDANLYAASISSSSSSSSSSSPSSAATPAARPQLHFQSAQKCQQCHQEIFSEWSQSWMAKAFTNPVFQQDFSRWQKYAIAQGDDPFSCLRCHAPVATLTGDAQLKNSVSREGVTCTVCHKVALVRERDARHYLVMDPRKNSLYGSSANHLIANSATSSQPSSAHVIRRSEALADSSLCAGCHLDVLADGTPLEHTYHEWKNSQFAKNGTQCMDCHMPLVADSSVNKTHRSHRFPGGHSSSELLNGVASIALLPREQKDSTAEPTKVLMRRLRVKVSNLRTGHNFPTGGAHPAKLVLKINIVSGKDETLFQVDKVYEFIFKNQQGSEVRGREMVTGWLDETLKPLEVRTENFEIPVLPNNSKIKLSLVYELIPVLMAEELPKDFYEKHYKPVIIDEIELLYSDL